MRRSGGGDTDQGGVRGHEYTKEIRMSLRIVGETSIDYFRVLCEKCGSQVRMEYLGWDPAMPHFKATCPTCEESAEFKVHVGEWKGLPREPYGT